MPFPTPKTSLAPIENILMESISSQAIIDAVRMKLFDLMDQAPKSAETLARELGVKVAPLEAMLDMMVVRDLVVADGKTYANSAMSSEYLVSSSPLYQGTAMEIQEGWNALVRSGIPALLKGESLEREKTDGDWSKPEIMNATLQHALTGQIQKAVEYLQSIPEFEGFRTMADIGGNHGQYSMELLDLNPQMTSTILDLPDVIEAAGQRCAAEGYGDRINCTAFDLRKDELPKETYDIVFTSHILYACTSELEDVFTRIHGSLKPGGCFVSHHFTPEGGASEYYSTSVELLTRLMGYETHHLPLKVLEEPLTKAGFERFSHTFTGMEGQTLLLVARKK